MDEHVYNVADGSVYGAATFAGRYQRCQHMLDEAMDVLSGFSAEDFANTVGRLADQLAGTVAWWESVFEDLDAFFEAVIEQRMDTKPEDNYGGGLVDALVGLWKQGQGFSKENVKAILLDAFVGGIDTSSVSSYQFDKCVI
jgi:4-hydroxyphenylacetaldehyde oxime monooxygenase